MQEELATVRGIVDLSPQEALDEAHNFLWGNGYTIVDRTESALTAERSRPNDTSVRDTPSLTVTATSQPGGVRITISGSDREGLQERRDEWLAWSEHLPRREQRETWESAESPEGAERVLVEASGVDGHVELLSDRVRIKRRGLLAKGKGGDREIPLGQLGFVEFKSGFTGGHIQFVLVGHEAQRGWRRNTEYEVQFKAQQAPDFEAIKREVERRVVEGARGSEQTTAVPPGGDVRSDQPHPQDREPVSEKAPETAPVESPTSRPTGERRSGDARDIPELIRKLADLRDAGVVSDEEFEAKKANLLDRQRQPELRRRRRRR